jgi:SAM-dependent methyltransferase
VEASDTKIDSMPWPGEELVHRVTNQTDRRLFLESGERSVRDLDTVLALAGRRLTEFRRILDFGCGCSRTLLWMEDVARESELFGCDIDERMILWGRENVPWATFTVNQPLPPLDYPDGHFDLVYASSVFTHIDENYQDQWLAELRRVTSPGGMLLLSVHGEHVLTPFEKVEKEAGSELHDIRGELGERGICFLDQDCFVGGPFPDFYHSTFHAPWYVFEHWGRYFSVRAYVSRGHFDYQDYVLLERPPDDQPLNPIAVKRGVQSPPPATEAAPVPKPPGTLLGHSTDDWRRYLERVLRRIARKVLGPAPEAPPPVQPAHIAGGLPVTLLIDRMGKRLNRLEADLWRALRDHGERLDQLDSRSRGSED